MSYMYLGHKNAEVVFKHEVSRGMSQMRRSESYTICSNQRQISLGWFGHVMRKNKSHITRQAIETGS